MVGVDPSGDDSWLRRDDGFVDPDGTRWVAPASVDSRDWSWNGSSIPRALALFLGTPFFGCHRGASVFHDDYDQTAAQHGHSRRRVDRLFHGGLRANGVGHVKAKTTYYGVRLGGGLHWQAQTGLDEDAAWDVASLSTDDELGLLLAVERLIEERDPTLDELDPRGSMLAGYLGN